MQKLQIFQVKNRARNKQKNITEFLTQQISIESKFKQINNMWKTENNNHSSLLNKTQIVS